MFKVSYQKEFGNNGTVFTQKIKVNRDVVDRFNKYVNQVKNKINDKYKKEHSIDYQHLKILTYLDELYKDYNYLSLTQLHFFMYFMSYYEHKDIKRIKDRNTIIEII